MAVSQNFDLEKSAAFRRLNQFVTDVQSRPPEDLGPFGEFEVAVRCVIHELGQEIIASQMIRYDVTVPEVSVGDVAYRPNLRSKQTYMTSCGPVQIERQLYVARHGGGRSICPLEKRIGIIGGFWTPRAGEEACQLVADVTPGRAETLLRELTGMRPSKTSLDRVAKTVSTEWESHREEFEKELRASTVIPEEAATVAVSLDGVMAPMRPESKAGDLATDRPLKERRKRSGGPEGYREVGCATMTFYDSGGERLSTVRWGRMSEAKKATLCAEIGNELESVLQSRPDLRVAKLSDGAESHWDFLSGLEPEGDEILDFYHAASHLKTALDAAYGEGSTKSAAVFENKKVILKNDPDGVDQVVRSLSHLQTRRKGRRVVRRVVRYFRKNRDRMRYCRYQSRGLPIGTGVMEATCKTLVTARMKHAGMRWTIPGGQAILTLRGLIQSDRWVRAWELLSQSFTTAVTTGSTTEQLGFM